jgi:hypothetical protein
MGLKKKQKKKKKRKEKKKGEKKYTFHCARLHYYQKPLEYFSKQWRVGV